MTYQNATVDRSDVLVIPYAPPTSALPLETFTLSSLVERRGLAEFEVVQRLEFELLVWCRAGSGYHEVAFERIDVTPGRIVHIRPGQVHRWVFDRPYEAQLFLLKALDSRANWSPGPNVIETDEGLARDLEQIVTLTDPTERSSPLPLRGREAVRDLLVALLGLDRPRPKGTTHLDVIYQDFERLLGQAPPSLRTVKDCADRIGCSTRTLTRACEAAGSDKPKARIDGAVALEAQRQLSEGRSASAVAEALGFVELSHFTRFFKRVAGETPSAFAAGFAHPDP